MNVVVGATGATGRLLVAQLLERDQHVKVIVRSVDRLPRTVREHSNLTLVEASILDLSNDELTELVQGATAIASCLGHTLSFKGVFGHPRRLVTDATRRLCEALRASPSPQPAKFVLMNTTGVQNRDRKEPVPFVHRCVVGFLRACVPPHADNEAAADYLRRHVGPHDKAIEWVVVRPDGLINDEVISAYDLHASPTRSAICDAGKTSRINVASFMSDLIIDPICWQQWSGQMPVIYNRG